MATAAFGRRFLSYIKLIFIYKLYIIPVLYIKNIKKFPGGLRPPDLYKISYKNEFYISSEYIKAQFLYMILYINNFNFQILKIFIYDFYI